MVKITKATLIELDQVTDLFNQYRMFYQKPSDIPNAKKFFQERLSNNDSEIFVIHSESSEIIGFMQLYPLFSSTRMRKLWLLNDLFILASFRGRGYSHLLINKAKELCKSTHACGLTLETGKENKTGNSLYLKNGFILNKEFNAYSWNE